MAAKSPVKIQKIFEFTTKTLEGDEVALSKYKGKVILVINVASM